MAAQTPPTPLGNLDTIVGIFGTLVTAFAVIVGAIWAYYKFVRGRTFTPLACRRYQLWSRRRQTSQANISVPRTKTRQASPFWITAAPPPLG